MNGRQLSDARQQLGWSTSEMGMALGLAGDCATKVRDMEAGRRQISGTIEALVRAFMEGFRPR